MMFFVVGHLCSAFQYWRRAEAQWVQPNFPRRKQSQMCRQEHLCPVPCADWKPKQRGRWLEPPLSLCYTSDHFFCSIVRRIVNPTCGNTVTRALFYSYLQRE